MNWYYFVDLQGKRHYTQSRDEAERRRSECGGGHAIIQTNNPPPSEDTLPADAYLALRRHAEQVKDIPRDHLSIRAGRAIEGILEMDIAKEDLETCETKHILQCALFLAKILVIPDDKMKQAVELYCAPNGVIAHYRHNAAQPNTFTGHGAFLVQIEDNVFRIDHVSEDRVTYGKRPKRVELPSIKDALQYVDSLASKHWYSSFIDPHARALGFTDIPFTGDTSFRSWRDRAAEGDI